MRLSALRQFSIISSKLIEFLFVKPTRWLMLYVLVVIIFSLLYMNIPYGFYHNNLDKEPHFHQNIIEKIMNEIGGYLEGEMLNPEFNFLQLQYLSHVENDHDGFASLNTFMLVSNSKYILTSSSFFKLDIKIYGIDVISQDESKRLVKYLNHSPSAIEMRKAILNKDLNTTMQLDVKTYGNPKYGKILKNSAEGKSYNNTFIVSDKNLQLSVLNLLQVLKNEASGVAGEFERMFYLSAVTITTLGYGDIVPITPLARLLVALESLIGIIIMGLFINDVAYKKSM